VFDDAERLARRLDKSRSEFYSDALREYLARHSGEEITDALDRLCSSFPATDSTFVAEASRRRLERVEW
jgi:predicted transcriptional regulator